MSFSIVITTHFDDGMCYLTAHSLLAQVRAPSSDEAEVIVVADGGTEAKWEKLDVRCLRGVFGSPQASRDAGIRVASHNDVLVCESHVVINNVHQLVNMHHALKSALTFPARVDEGPEMFNVYGSETDWDGNLWFKRLAYTKKFDNPYRVSQFGQSCFVLDRDFYLKSGGYTDLLKGWGGEEPLLCLKAWMLGRELWMVPAVWHAHYLTVGAHSGRTSEDEFKHNMAIVGYVIAGKMPAFPVTPGMKAERERIVAGPYKGDLHKLRSHLASMGVN